ncbi:hypothetical protein CGRA01v4_03154 [Colletotrichum graminicola]|uniref:Kynurenine formamidase n=1 Tax=Colletotrichum graminicola (strain M1.001 / M2 / FGSC 10212) TaxID=645133 RepID=E3QB89_COLGM|nr:uncharacterized protein GLRG_03271 [Colletotrichum graminicola M1.001]EFQ28127.1 hypothetical protein GLRG_03271 [Colletotrichum graminicola M1.001]WDK11875.1 hypothetical protein CGRA01v4_03154 [Colletotrichum graminicola]
MSGSLKFTEHRYAADSELQKLGVWELPQNADNAAGYWLIYIHGGAWRDPQKTLYGFERSIDEFIKTGSPALECEVRGFVSIDYRLSPHPSFPQDSAVTPPAELRCAQHPDHLRDVWSALAFLQREYDIQDRYILIGHSAGATLAFQLPMGSVALGAAPPPEVKMPAAFIGLAGIYELYDFNARHEGYTQFIVGAFGQDQESWNKVMPATFSGSFKDALPANNLILLAWSPQDTLVDEPEIDAMASKLGRDGVEYTIRKNLSHDHDFVWEDGKQVARLLSEAFGMLRKP